MNKVLIPSSPNWYETDIVACSPDNTVVFGSRCELVIIKPTADDQPDDVQIIAKAHASKIISVNINKNWGSPHKYAVSVSEDKIIKLWDLETLTKKMAHNKHASLDKSKVIGACFAGDDRIVSVSEKGAVVVWNLNTNETNVLNSLFPKGNVTCLSICPHAKYVAAFGLNSGLIVVADLRRSGTTVFTLRGHMKPVVSLSWCPAPYNIFPTKPQNVIIQRNSTITENALAIKEEETTKTEEKSGETAEKENSQNMEELSDFLKECVDLKNTIQKHLSSVGGLTNTLDEDNIKENDQLNIGEESAIKQEETTQHEEMNKKNENHSTRIPQSCELDIDVKKQEEPNKDLDASHSSNESKTFESVSSCDIDLGCVKPKTCEAKDENQTDAEVFHDALCENLDNTVTNISKVETPCIPKASEEAPRREFLLASSGKDQNIYIWRAGTDGRMETFLKMPFVKNHGKTSSNPEKQFIPICWVTPTMLLSSSKNAELLKWNLPKPSAQEAKLYKIVHSDHWSVIFSIKSPIVYCDDTNFLDKHNTNVWTIGMDRQIINTDIKTMTNLACYPCQGGSINCLVGSPLDPNRLALGTGEALINIWNLGHVHKKQIVFITFYQKIAASVTALAWHPSDEALLAWGTAEGRIGIQDVTKRNKPSKILPHFFKSQIHKLEWGPLDAEINKHKLFVVGEGQVAIFDVNSNTKDPELLDLPDNTTIYTLSWKPDYSTLMAVSKTGVLIEYSRDLKISRIIYDNLKVQLILWNPDAAGDDVSVSKYAKTFVSLIKFTGFAVFDLNVEGEDTIDNKIIAQFDNRDIKINSIVWSPHSTNHLAFVDDTGVAQVYDVARKAVISTHVNPCLHPLLSVIWSPTDPNYIIVGSLAHTTYVLNVSENPALSPKEIGKVRSEIMKNQKKASTDLLEKEQNQLKPLIQELEASNTKSKKVFIATEYFYKIGTKKQSDEIRRVLHWKLGKPVESNIGGDFDIDILDIFGDTGDMKKLMNINLSGLEKSGKYQQANMMNLFSGDVGESIKKAIKQKRVNPWIISMSPMVSPTLWQTACETYIEQLLEEPEADPFEVVSYQLALHKVEDAINYLCENKLFRDAIVLARARFGPNNPIVSEVLLKWAKNQFCIGNFELAACCYITLGKYDEAATVLFRRSDPEMMGLAVQLAELSGNQELHKAALFRLNAFTKATNEDPETNDAEKTVDEIKTAGNNSDQVEENGCQDAQLKNENAVEEILKTVCDESSVKEISNERVDQDIPDRVETNESQKVEPTNGQDDFLKDTKVNTEKLCSDESANALLKMTANKKIDKEASDSVITNESQQVRNGSDNSLKEVISEKIDGNANADGILLAADNTELVKEE